MNRLLPNVMPAHSSTLITTAATATPPTSQQLIRITIFDLIPIHEVAFRYLPGAALCQLLSTCSTLQLLYLSLLTEEGIKRVKERCSDLFSFTVSIFGTEKKFSGHVAKELFNQTLDNRLSEYKHIMHGPDTKGYVQYWRIAADRSLINKLRNGETSVKKMSERQQGWNKLESQLMALPPPNDWLTRQRNMFMITWLGREMMKAPGESVIGPNTQQYMFDGSLSLKRILIFNTRKEPDFLPLPFESLVSVPAIEKSIHDREVKVDDLFDQCDTSVLDVINHPHVQAALGSGDVTVSQLFNRRGGFSPKFFKSFLDFKTIDTLLSRGELKLSRLLAHL